MNTVKGLSYCSSAQIPTECSVSIRDEVASNLSSPLTELSSLDEDDVSSLQSIESATDGFDERAAAQVKHAHCFLQVSWFHAMCTGSFWALYERAII